MQEHGYWVGCATTVEASIAGQQLLAQEIAREVRMLWQRVRLWTIGVMPQRPVAPARTRAFRR